MPRDEVLYVDVELEPSFQRPTDKGSRGLAAMISALPDRRGTTATDTNGWKRLL